MKESTKIIFFGILSSILLIISCIYFKYDMLLKDKGMSGVKPHVKVIDSVREAKPKVESFPQLVDTKTEKNVIVSTKAEPQPLEVSSLNYKIEKELITIDGKMPLLENNDSLKLMLMSRCETITCDKKILFSPKQVEPKWKELATKTIKLFNSEKMEKANLKVEGNRIYISGDFNNKASKDKLDKLVSPYLTVYSIENNTTVVKQPKRELLKLEEPKVSPPNQEPSREDVQKETPKEEVAPETHSIKIIEEKISDILKEKHVNFYKSSSKITKKGKKTLDEIIVILKKQKNIHIEVDGHTDASGRAKVNQWISTERAKSVKAYLEGKGLNPKNITAKGFGETRLLLKNRPNNAINRRVEIKIKRI